MLNVPEHREFPRMAIDCGITYKRLDAQDTRRAIAKNISGGGVLFIAGERPEIGALMEIKVQAGTLSIPPLSAVVEVVRVAPHDGEAGSTGGDGGNGHYQVGARIMTMK